MGSIQGRNQRVLKLSAGKETAKGATGEPFKGKLSRTRREAGNGRWRRKKNAGHVRFLSQAIF